jgi:hypothetical protein
LRGGLPFSPGGNRGEIKKAVVASPAPRLLKDFLGCLLSFKSRGALRPGKIKVAKIIIPGPAGLRHFLSSTLFKTLKISAPPCQGKNYAV